MAFKNARFIKYPDNPLDYDSPPTIVRKLTPQEEETLLDLLLEKVGGDIMSDTLYEVAQEATKGQADSITWD
jgi:hypothetical protein